MDPTEIGKALDEIGSRIGPYGEAAWQVLVRQMVVEGVINTIFNITGLLILFAFGIGATAVYRHIYLADVRLSETGEVRDAYGHRSAPNRNERFAVWFIGAAGWFAIVWFFLWCLMNSLIKLFNPEYAALRTLLDTIHP